MPTYGDTKACILYPVARIEGVTYAQIPTRFISNINIIDPSDDASLRNQLSEQRNSFSSIGTAFTGYTYKYLTGVTSISKPNSTLEYYNYDAYGRLVSVINHNNQTIGQYTYNLANPQPAAFNTWCVNTPVMKSLYNCPCGGFNRSYNSVYYGGSQRPTTVEMANENAEISVAYVQGIRLMPDCTNPVQTVPVKLQAYYNKQYSSTVPSKIYIDFIQSGTVVFTESFTMDEVNGPLNPKLLYIPVGDYTLSFRTTAENNYSFKGVLMYELFNSNNTSGSGSPLIANQEVVMFQPGNQYERRVSPCKIIP